MEVHDILGLIHTQIIANVKAKNPFILAITLYESYTEFTKNPSWTILILLTRDYLSFVPFRHYFILQVLKDASPHLSSTATLYRSPGRPTSSP